MIFNGCAPNSTGKPVHYLQQFATIVVKVASPRQSSIPCAEFVMQENIQIWDPK